MMHSVPSSTVDKWVLSDVLPIMNKNSPDTDKNKQADICKLLKWEEKWKDVVRDFLCATI